MWGGKKRIRDMSWEVTGQARDDRGGGNRVFRIRTWKWFWGQIGCVEKRIKDSVEVSDLRTLWTGVILTELENIKEGREVWGEVESIAPC